MTYYKVASRVLTDSNIKTDGYLAILQALAHPAA